MNLYLVERTDHIDYDEPGEAVVCAPDADTAREYVRNWLHSRKRLTKREIVDAATVKQIGTAEPGLETGEVVSHVYYG